MPKALISKASSTSPADAPARVENIPLRFSDDPYVWASWLYYEDHLTQADIAEVMGISRPTVNAYLASAREKGIVNISIDPERLASLSMAQQLKERFGLHDCMVIPGDGGANPLIHRLGIAGAQVLRKVLKSGDTLAVVWGRTVRAVGANMAQTVLREATVVQATGGTGSSFDYTPEICAGVIALAVGARYVPLTGPALVRSPAVRDLLVDEPLLKTQFETLASANRMLFGIESMGPASTVHTSGFYDRATVQHYVDQKAIGVIAGRFIDEHGRRVPGPLDERTIGISFEMLSGIHTRMAVAGGLDKAAAILAAIRGGLVSVLITDVATGRGILHADGGAGIEWRSAPRQGSSETAAAAPTKAKKFINDADDFVDEALQGAVAAFRDYLMPIRKSNRALVARNGPRTGKVGLVVGSGMGCEPSFLGCVGRGLADAVALGDVYNSPGPDPILDCALAASGGRGVLLMHGNYTGDGLNFSVAAEYARNAGLEVRRLAISDDITSGPIQDKASRRGIAGSLLVVKAAGAACDLGWSLDECEALAKRANDRTSTVGVALEASSLPSTRRRTFEIGPGEMEFGVGITGNLGTSRLPMASADAIADQMLDRIFSEITIPANGRVAVLVNSLGATPMMELLVLYRRVEQRLASKNIAIAARWVGSYWTAIDTVGASISIMLLAHPCDSAAMRVG
jgi:dihydroxyacetone kinase-like protein